MRKSGSVKGIYLAELLLLMKFVNFSEMECV